MFQIKTFTFNPVQENTYIIYNENNDCIIIDPGCYFDSEKEELTAFIKNHKLEPKLLLNTHLLEKEILEMAPASGLMFNLPFDNYQGDVIYLKEGDVISLGDDKLQVIHAPGHSPGSICFYCEKQNFLIGGDVLFQNSIGRTDLPYGDHDALIKNIKEKLFKLPPDVTVYPGHGPETTIGSEIKGNPYLQ